MTPEPGIHEDVDFQTYLSWDALSKSGLMMFIESPAAYQEYLRRGGRNPTAEMIVGSAVDCLLSEGEDEFRARYFRLPKSVTAKPTFTLEEAQGRGDKFPLLHDWWTRAWAMAEAVMADDEAAEIIERSRKQLSMIWPDAETGLLLKCRPDFWHGLNLYDLKATHGTDVRSWRQTCWRYRYDFQAAIYCEGAHYLTGVYHDWSWLVVKDRPEHSVVIYDLEMLDLVEAWEEIRQHLKNFKTCKDRDYWPAKIQKRQPFSMRRKR
jgi:hypothetical protein